ncbi:MAG: class B sortase [Lachnospiraceae bacterium]|nr:class B sortase [Lachnospiraceae bacterium]MCM1488959.1 class B sortase [Bacillota bacterium]
MKKKICIILIAVFVALLGTSTYFICDYYRQASEQSELYDSLAEAVNQAQKSDEANEPVEKIPYNEEKTLLSEYAELFLQNTDMVGWIQIEDTNINYPVMHTPDNPDFYLKHGFDKGYTDYGCPYVQENCDVQLPTDNVIIYGHHMKNGTMFADLEKLKSEDFYKEHKTISFNTLTDKCEYEIIAVFKTFVYSDSPESFKYYRFVNAETPQDFSAFIEKCKELSLYDTGVSAEYGDKLITLSTCEYSRTNGRLVVVAKRV